MFSSLRRFARRLSPASYLARKRDERGYALLAVDPEHLEYHRMVRARRRG